VGCRETLAKRELIRVVRGPDGIAIDPGGKLSGRGAYVHEQRACWEKALAGSLAKALRTELGEQERRALEEHMNSLTDEQDG